MWQSRGGSEISRKNVQTAMKMQKTHVEIGCGNSPLKERNLKKTFLLFFEEKWLTTDWANWQSTKTLSKIKTFFEKRKCIFLGEKENVKWRKNW